MTAEAFRSFLYPLGFIANLLFSLRVFQQWIGSEKKKKSHVTTSFWILSLSANSIMTLHSFIQLQYPVCIIQGLNAVIAWRNLSLMRGSYSSWKSTVAIMLTTVFLLTTFFVLQGLLIHSSSWMHPPTMPWSKKEASDLFWGWHCFGILGMLLFASRFWIQWWLSEKNQVSQLGPSFWWVSLIGTSVAFCYFYRLHDLVNVLSYGTGFIPYLRNLILLKKERNPASYRKETIFIFAGEQSGDLLGGSLIEALKEKNPSLLLYGVGGQEMRKNGLHCIIPMEKFQVMGFTDVFKNFPKLFIHFQKIKKRILHDQPEGVVLIDYPDFNMRMEKALRKNGYKGKIIHYVSPTVWAWRRSRIKALAKTVDLLLSIFPFEKECFSKTSLAVSYVGHPLVKAIEKYPYISNWKTQFGISKNAPLLALFPGSRIHEIEANLPLQLKAAKKLISTNPEVLVAISVAREDLKKHILQITAESDLKICLIPGNFRYELMKDAFLALATSGTVTLELALHSLPTVVTYQLKSLNYFLGKHVFKISLPHFCIVNIILGKTVFPECITKHLDSETIVNATLGLLEQKEECRASCDELKKFLQTHDASERAALEIQRVLKGT